MAELFTLPELASYLQTDVDTASATLARANATALVEGYTRKRFTEQAEVTEVKRLRNGKVLLGEPVASVTQVRLVDGTNRLPTYWTFDGIRTVHIGYGYILNMPEHDEGYPTVEVTYTTGYETVPADVKAVAIAAAARAYTNPTGLRSETIGSYTYTNAGGDDDVTGNGLLASERRVLNRYTRQAYTVTLG